mgnify:CR=1 FL=1
MSVLDEIAAECGVHRRTVSRILSGQCKETWASMRGKAELVRKTAKRLGYRPNAAAKAISTGRFNTIALFQDTPPRSRGYLPQDLLAGIHSALGEHDMDLIEKICDPVIVMAEGSVLFKGNFNEVKNNDTVIEAYLGKGINKN